MPRQGHAREHAGHESQDDADEPGNDVEAGEALGVVHFVGRDGEGLGYGSQGGERPFHVPLQHGLDDALHGADGACGSRGIRSVCLNEHSRLFAAQKAAGEVSGDIDDEGDVAAFESVLRVFLAHDPGYSEVVGSAQGGFHAAREYGLLPRHEGCGKVFGVVVDGVAEEEELDHGDADDHAKRETVAAQLKGFLVGYGEASPEGEYAVRHFFALPKLS